MEGFSGRRFDGMVGLKTSAGADEHSLKAASERIGGTKKKAKSRLTYLESKNGGHQVI